MASALERVAAKVLSQRERIPSLYGDVDFSIRPERFTDDLADESMLGGEFRSRRPQLLADHAQVELLRAYTMLGDLVADAYAALMPKYGFRRLVAMLSEACDKGVEAVEGAPAELVDFIGDMERVPDWLDMDLVRQGARIDRNMAANLGPFLIRGAFIATFINKYAALPMALTGTLSNNSAAQRVKETASFFSTTVLPGALDRHGPGFKAAAQVRLMHSMVRFNALKRSRLWAVAVYGIPIPQVDQMPAGLIAIFLLAVKVLRSGRKEFTREERARVELARYRCFLLGLPEDLLADTPEGIVRILSTRSATLREGYDDSCSELVRATMNAYLPADRSMASRVFDAIERRFAKVTFLRSFAAGDIEKARRMGIEIERKDYLIFAVVSLFLFTRLKFFAVAARVPGLSAAADWLLVRKLKKILAGYGHAAYVTDADKYKPSGAADRGRIAA